MIVTTESCPTGSQSATAAAVGDNITTSCWLNYKGSIAPQLQWSPGGQTSNHTNSSTVTTSLSAVVGMTTVPLQSCSVSFPRVPVHPTCDSWQSSEIHVTCMYVLLLSRTSVLWGLCSVLSAILKFNPSMPEFLNKVTPEFLEVIPSPKWPILCRVGR